METANNMAEFEALLEKSFESGTPKENTVVNGKIIAIENSKIKVKYFFSITFIKRSYTK